MTMDCGATNSSTSNSNSNPLAAAAATPSAAQAMASLQHHDDEILFNQPTSSHNGDCLICCLPIPDNQRSELRTCCFQLLCNGCDYAYQKAQNETRLANTCPFCREIIPASDAESDDRLIRKSGPSNKVAMRLLGEKFRSEGNHELAFQHFTIAAELGDVESDHRLSLMHILGQGRSFNTSKFVLHAERAAIGGHNTARYNLGLHEGKNNRVERAIKHFRISAQLGDSDSMKKLFSEYKRSNISRPAIEKVLRKHQYAVEAMKSGNRKAAEEFALSRM